MSESQRPYDTISSLFFTALWLQRSLSTVVQEIQPTKDIDLTGYKTLPTKAITCLPMETIFLEWPAALPPECEQSCPSPSDEDSNVDSRYVWPHHRWRSSMYYLQHWRSRVGSFFAERTESSSSNISGNSLKKQRHVSKRYTGRMTEDAFATHMITWQGRDHSVNVQSEQKNLVIVNVHFEPELALRRLRERFRLITPHWPSFPTLWTSSLVISISVNQKEGLTCGTKPSPKETRERPPCFFFPHVLEIAQPDYTRKDSPVIGIIRTLSRIYRFYHSTHG